MERQTQMQERREQSIDSKLDRIMKRLDELMGMVEEIYPDEAKMKKSYLKKEAKRDKAITSGKSKLHAYRSFAELDKAIG